MVSAGDTAVSIHAQVPSMSLNLAKFSFVCVWGGGWGWGGVGGYSEPTQIQSPSIWPSFHWGGGGILDLKPEVLKWTGLSRSLVLATRCATSRGAGSCTREGACMLRSNASRVMVTWDPSLTMDRHTHTHNWKYYLTATLLSGGKMCNQIGSVNRLLFGWYIVLGTKLLSTHSLAF